MKFNCQIQVYCILKHSIHHLKAFMLSLKHFPFVNKRERKKTVFKDLLLFSVQSVQSSNGYFFRYYHIIDVRTLFKKKGGLPNPQLLVLLMLCRMFSNVTIFIRKGDKKVMKDFMAREYSKKQD